MDIRATAKYLPISPQKIRLVCDQVRGMDALMAVEYLRFMPQKGAGLISKVIRSAMANAENNFEIDPNTLFIESIQANGGPIRRWRRFGARGRFKPIQHRTSHVMVILRERAEE